MHLERDAGGVAGLLIGEIGRLTGTTIMPLYAQAHRWRHALVELPLGAPALPIMRPGSPSRATGA
ncbi:hypothetical protein ACFQ4K_25945 [Tistrella bauzanensis]